MNGCVDIAIVFVLFGVIVFLTGLVFVLGAIIQRRNDHIARLRSNIYQVRHGGR